MAWKRSTVRTRPGPPKQLSFFSLPGTSLPGSKNGRHPNRLMELTAGAEKDQNNPYYSRLRDEGY